MSPWFRPPAHRAAVLALFVSLIASGCVTVGGSATDDPGSPAAPAIGTAVVGTTSDPSSMPTVVSPEPTVAATTSAMPSAADDPWAVPFLSRPASAPIWKKRGCDDIVIEGMSFRDLGPDVEAIHLEKCHGVTIRANDFARVAQAITIIDSTDVRIEWNRYFDIVGPHGREDGVHRANFVQLVGVSRGDIAHNKGKGGDTEDIVSLFHSGGTEASPFIVEYNQFEGVDWTSGSGSGIASATSASAYSIARYNTLLNPGQVGIFIAGGTNHSIVGNTVYGERRPGSNVGIYVWNQSDSRCAGNEVRDNKVSWTTAKGLSNGSWNAQNCGPISGWKTNDWDAPIDPATLEVTL